MGSKAARVLGNVAIGVLGWLMSLDACSSGHDACNAGHVRACPSSICSGTQTCRADGTYGPCNCVGTGGFAGSVGGSFGGFGGSSGVGTFGGFGGSGGFGGTGGSGGSVATPPQLGQQCISNFDCGDLLFCVPADQLLFDNGAAAHGYCTLPCTNNCAALGSDAVCHDFGSASFCVRACSFGPIGLTTFDPNKCLGRPDVACAPTYAASSLDLSCTLDAQCLTGQKCGDTQRCLDLVPVCLPSCNSDADCAAGLKCDPLDGLCRATVPTGKKIGEECTPTSAAGDASGTGGTTSADAAADGGSRECRGSCLEIAAQAGAPAYMCTESCTFGAFPSCGWGPSLDGGTLDSGTFDSAADAPAGGNGGNGGNKGSGGAGTSDGASTANRADAFCMFASPEVRNGGGPSAGDRGSCGQLCDCNTDCLHPRMICRDFANVTIQQLLGRTGFCTLPEQVEGGIETGILCD